MAYHSNCCLDGGAWPILAILILCSFGGDLRAAGKSGGKTGFATALDGLKSLGLPDVSKGEYVNLSVANFQVIDSSGNAQLTGNAWRLPGEGKGSSEQTYVTLNGDVLLVSEATGDRSWDAPGGRSRTMASMTGRAEPADLKKDCEALLTALEQQNQDSPYTSPDPLLFAAFARQCGYTVEADRICEVALTRAKNAQKTVRRAISTLASARYDSALMEYSRKPDLTKLADALASIRSDCGTNWDYNEAVGLLESRIRAQIKKGSSESPAMKKLSPEDRKFIDDLQKKAASIQGNNQGIWLFPGTSLSEQGERADSFTAALQGRGLRAFPVLALLEKESGFLSVIHVQHYSPLLTSGMTWIMLGGNSREKQPSDILEGMPRPMSLSDLPKLAMRPLLVSEERYNPERATALSEWRKEHPFKTSDEAAWYFVKVGEYHQFLQAARYLVAQGQQAKVEEYLLGALSDPQKWRLLMAYISDQKTNAAPFAKKVSELIKQKKLSPPEEFGDSLNRTLRQLDTMVQSLDDNMLSVGTGKISPYEIEFLVRQELPKKKFRDGLALVVKTAVMQKDVLYRRKILSWVLALPYQQNDGGLTPPDTVPPVALAKEWEELLNDTRETVPGETVGGYAAFALELISAGMDFMPIQALDTSGNSQGYVGMDADWFKWIMERGRQRLAGKPVPSRKESLTLPEEQRKTLLTEAEKQYGGQLADWLQKLGFAQRLALLEALAEREQLAAKINGVTGKIDAVQIEGAVAEPVTWTKLKGATFDRPLLDQIIKLYAAQLKKSGGVLVLVSRSSVLDGWQLSVRQSGRRDPMSVFALETDLKLQNNNDAEAVDADFIGVGIQGLRTQVFLELNGEGVTSTEHGNERAIKEFDEAFKGVQAEVGNGLTPTFLFIFGLKKTTPPPESEATSSVETNFLNQIAKQGTQ